MLTLLTILGDSAPKNSCIGFAFQSLLTLLSKCFILLYSITIDYAISVFNYIIMSAL